MINLHRFDPIDPLGFYCGYLGKEARRLTPEELDAYDVLDRDLAERVRVLKVPFLPMPGGKGGMTLGRFIFLTSDEDRSGGNKLLAHELVHTRQFSKGGAIKFPLRYLLDYAQKLKAHKKHNVAYRAIPAEEEARAGASSWSRRRAMLVNKRPGGTLEGVPPLRVQG